MKKLCIIFALLFIIILTAAVNVGKGEGTNGNDFSFTEFFSKGEETNASAPKAEEYFRIHIRADSNEKEDQAVKYLVKEEIVRLLTPWIAACESKEEVVQTIEKELFAIEQAASSVLKNEGFSYGARASVRKESFPTRVYENVTLYAGEYDALIVALGSGKGDNWWCVVYPPLCFSGGKDIVYRSKIKEIVEKFFA